MDSNVSIRPAAIADIPVLCELLDLLFSQEDDFVPDREKQARGLRMILDQPDMIGHIYCAVLRRGSEVQCKEGASSLSTHAAVKAHKHVEEHVVGMVSILFTVSTAEGGRAAWLEDMVVRPEVRGRGVGESLLTAAVNGAQACGCLRVTLLTDGTNVAAQRFYQKSGFGRSDMVPMRKYLPDNQAGHLPVQDSQP